MIQIFNKSGYHMPISLMIKRVIDFVVSLSLLILLSPLIAIISIIILVFDGKPIFFTQPRPGKNNKIFRIYKFRTMNLQKSGEDKSDFERMTKLGSFMRKTSLDELPQLFNVIKGELSLVGPRPLLVEYLPLYDEIQKKRHDVKPGITGWAQINGRNAISWEQKFSLDVWYVNNWSLLLDLKILYLTFLKVIKKSDVNSSTNQTMDKFTGSK